MATVKQDLMNCDTETGTCEVPLLNNPSQEQPGAKPVKLIYFTDPICSSCWGIEPQLRKLKQEYGAYFDIEYRMGGLLKSWDEYGGSDVNGPKSVAQHWNDAGAYYNMPINGAVWDEDPLDSSYPPSIAFKAAQLQGDKKANQFLRRIKEMVFTEKKNIARWKHLLQAAKDAGLNIDQFEADHQQKATVLFEEDLSMAREWGVRGFPTIYFIDKDDNRFKVYGSKPYQVYEEALLKLLPGKVAKTPALNYDSILKGFKTITLKEFAVFYDKNLEDAEALLQQLEVANKVKRTFTTAGVMWQVIKG